MAKIAIIGGGWVGCHLASKLKDKHDVVLFDKNERLFEETSSNNQNRLHLGFHYARSFKTRELCRSTYNRFLHDYNKFTDVVTKNYYCVPNKSNIDFMTYLKIFDDFVWDLEAPPSCLMGIAGAINTQERYIDFRRVSEHFNTELRSISVQKTIRSTDGLSAEFDLVINATNNMLNSGEDSFFELTTTLMYTRLAKDLPFDALTLVDGSFFSLYPYDHNRFSLTDVEHTPIAKFIDVESLRKFKLTAGSITHIRDLMEAKAVSYYPEFLKHFAYDGYFTAVKSKPHSASADRYPVVTVDGNVVSCYTGKIQGVYVIEDQILKML